MVARRGRLLVAVIGLASVAWAALAVGPGSAATAVTVSLTPTIENVTYGGKIGYVLGFTNSGPSTVNHVVVTVDSDAATYSDDDSTLCAGDAGDATRMICTPPGGSMVPGDSFTVGLRFTAPPSGTSVSTGAALTVSAQTNGSPNNNGTTLAEAVPVSTPVSGGVGSLSTYARPGDGPLATGLLGSGHSSNFRIDLPSDLALGSSYGLAVSLNDQQNAPPCGWCLPWSTEITIPAAADAAVPTDPFLGHPYTWTMDAQYPPGFKLTGIAYKDDTGYVHFPLPSCLTAVLSATSPACVDSATQDPKTKTLHATGKSIQNGNMGWG